MAPGEVPDELPLPPGSGPHDPQIIADAQGRLLLVSWWPGYEDRELFTMMAEEAITWSWVRHPNVLRLRGSRSTENDVFFYREHVPSWAFAPVVRGALRQGLMVPPGVASAIIADVLLGVHAVHTCRAPSGDALGMVHRTIDPQHVLIGLDGVARLQVPDLDFLDARTGCRGPAAVIRTRFGHLAPEQLRGQVIDSRTDIYACALLLWELLTGRRGFLAESEIDLLYKIIAGDIASPSTLRPGLGPEVDAVVMRGLALSPEDRFPDAPRMLEALLAALPPASPGEVAAWVGSLGVAPWWPHSSRSSSSSEQTEESAPAGGSPYRTAPVTAPRPPAVPPPRVASPGAVTRSPSSELRTMSIVTVMSIALFTALLCFHSC